MHKIIIVDYGVGNLLSVRRAFEHHGADVRVEDKAQRVADAERLVLPGVGAFGDCARNLQSTGMRDSVLRFVDRERPLLGICVGMQLFFETSTEFGCHSGLGLIPGTVEAIPDKDIDGKRQKIPHVGWSPLHRARSAGPDSWQDGIMEDVSEGAATYFVHSFAARPVHEEHRLADTVYGGHRISAAVCKNNICGTQFHPEKSADVGLAMLRRFMTS